MCFRDWKKGSRGWFGILSLLLVWGQPIEGFADEGRAAQIVREQCAACHKFAGQPETKFNLTAPDLMWGGDKYQHAWLVTWLEGKEPNLYPNGYRWDKGTGPMPHMKLSNEDAEAVAGYLEKNVRDSRVKKNAIDLSNFSEIEAGFGAEIFKKFSCIACHRIKEEGNLVGGPISADLFNSGNRYNVDWLYRFALNPQDFTPHSGEYLADLSGLGVRYLVGYLMTQGVENYSYFEPWKTEYFKKAAPARGANVYREYCTQCHGARGEGDGPGAQGLDPKPAVHAKMALSDFPEDYLYNLIYYGGKSVGKSFNMPDWGLTLPPQDIADVIAFLRDKFKGEEGQAEAGTVAKATSGECPQPRKTKNAAGKYLSLSNPLQATPGNLKTGEQLFQKTAKPMACQLCHGSKGNGKGPGAAGVTPGPRNFTCAVTMKDISDGQLFGVIKDGSPGTAMPAFKGLKDDEVWKLVLYIRSLPGN